jgi:hypothetical protein
MPIALTTKANEESTFGIEISFTDEAGAALTPSSITWTLTDRAGTVVNGREGVVATPAATITIVLSGADLALGTAYEGATRALLIEWVYDSDLGTDLPGKEQIKFQIANLVAV